ncbi:formyl transferase [Colletotrichum karsti]|uniref:methionyl-tRNA formyltransferase n=1 Tax=Colletotrichum karsti TaxID=1095194 RepID=A0A9P6LN73_9PEZI|nr:formyl transferase [Colletotrichum karsti]KAF9882239.1 formyl transferase [Colletotrichum karsti]
MKWLAVRSAALARARLLRRPTCRSYSAAAATPASDPLRILFCGSDSFSCAALNALVTEKERNPGLIESLDVVVRPGKLSGRGMKEIRQVPLKMLAEDMKLPIHERDTFTGWQPEIDINLIIAVSFGLFVPPRLLNLAKYGGLNVHPSLLPDFRGPAPLQHTLLQRRTHTGVTLQTLHHKTFDHGTVLSQTPLPGIPIPENCTTQELHDIVTPLAADMLVDGLRRGLHVPPLKDVGWKPEGEEVEKLCHAPKLTKHDRQINWAEWSADDIVLRQRVLGPLWCEAVHHEDKKVMRMFLEHMQVVEMPEHIEAWEERYRERENGSLAMEDLPQGDREVKWVTWLWKPEGPEGKDPENWGQFAVPYFPEETGGAIFIPVMNGGCLRVPAIKVEGSRAKAAKKAIADFGQNEDVESSPTKKKGFFGDGAVLAGLLTSFLI